MTEMTDKLKVDAKTLRDISAVLEKDGRFSTLPNVLNSIADDIENFDAGRTLGNEPEKQTYSQELLREYFNRTESNATTAYLNGSKTLQERIDERLGRTKETPERR